MRPRQDIIEIFSSFAQFEADYFRRWITDSRLRRSMQEGLKQSEDTSESFWAIYWHKRWQAQAIPVARFHLTAYLQEAGYWAAQQTQRKFPSPQYTLPDLFQIAIAEVNTVLRDYKPERGSSLRTYAGLAFPSLLRDTLRQRQETDICTNWSLLRKVSKKRLLESLHQAGLAPTSMAQHQLAWMCFKTLYVQTPSSGTTKLPDPNRALWQAIADLYNQERQTQLPQPGAACTPEQLEQWLNHCAAWVRAYLYPPVASLNMPKAGQESGELQDDLPDATYDSLLAQAIAQDEAEQRQTQRTDLSTALMQAIQQLDATNRQLLHLYYHENLTQSDIAKRMELTQVTVSRRLTKAREALLTALVQWGQNTLNKPPTSNLIKDMSAALEEWLQLRQDWHLERGA